METRPAQYLTFRVASEDFILDAARVRGVLPAREVLPPGSVAMQGRLVPVVDLRKKMRIAPGGPRGRLPCVVVVEVTGSAGTRLIGFVADCVSEVVTLTRRDSNQGKIRVRGRLRRILNPDQVLSE